VSIPLSELALTSGRPMATDKMVILKLHVGYRFSFCFRRQQPRMLTSSYSGNTKCLLLWTGRLAQYTSYRLARAQSRGLVRSLQQKVLSQVYSHDSQADGNYRFKTIQDCRITNTGRYPECKLSTRKTSSIAISSQTISSLENQGQNQQVSSTLWTSEWRNSTATPSQRCIFHIANERHYQEQHVTCQSTLISAANNQDETI